MPDWIQVEQAWWIYHSLRNWLWWYIMSSIRYSRTHITPLIKWYEMSSQFSKYHVPSIWFLISYPVQTDNFHYLIMSSLIGIHTDILDVRMQLIQVWAFPWSLGTMMLLTIAFISYNFWYVCTCIYIFF